MSVSPAAPVPAAARTGVDGYDPRKAIRMAALGLEDELIASRWPWICTLCGRCENQCHMGINLMKTFRKARGLRDRDKVPGPIHKGTMMNLQRGNNLGIPRDDFLGLLADLGQELAADGCPGFYVPVDKKGANIITTINSKEPFGNRRHEASGGRFFMPAKDWTVSSTNWEGVNWGLFSGDDPAWKEQVGRVLENARRLECKTLLLPE
jgi:hypothetical protein